MNALTGIRIIDFTHVWQGPLATQLLADFGADVIKVERPGMGDWSRGYGPFANDGMSLVFAGLNRNKRSIVVDVRHPDGHEIVIELIRSADVFVHNFRPGVVQRLGLDFQSLRDINPRLIYAQSTGWGDHGPYVDRERKGHADMAAATAGLFSMDDETGEPRPPGISVDYPAGLLLTQAILLGLLERERSGLGQMVSTDLLSAAVMAGMWHGGAELNPHLASRSPAEHDLASTDAAIPRVWRTKDGFIEISAVFAADALAEISVALGLEDLSKDPRFRTATDRLANRHELIRVFGQRLREHTTAQWLEVFERHGVLSAEIKTYREALQDPQVLANGMVISVGREHGEDLRVVGNPIRMSRTPASVRLPPPSLGEHTNEILRELSFSEERIRRLRELGIIDAR